MHSSRQHAAADNPYQPHPESIVVLAPALGLEACSDTHRIKAALEALVSRGEQSNLSHGAKDALTLISRATEPELGKLDFLEVRLVSHGGTVATPRDVIAAVALVRQELESSAMTLPTHSPGGLTHISELVERRARKQVSEKENRQIEGLTKAITYLQQHGILPPAAKSVRSPSPETTQALTKHGMTWVWKDTTQSWDPRLNTRRNQSLFTAAPQYLKTIIGTGAPERQELIKKALNARAVEDDPELRLRRSIKDRELIGKLIRTAEGLLQCPEVSLSRVMRIQALYRFFAEATSSAMN